MPAGGIINYYEMFDIPVKAGSAQIAQAYLDYLDGADAEARTVAEDALATLSDPPTRSRYDKALAVASGRGECCPPPRRSSNLTPAVNAGPATVAGAQRNAR